MNKKYSLDWVTFYQTPNPVWNSPPALPPPVSGRIDTVVHPSHLWTYQVSAIFQLLDTIFYIITRGQEVELSRLRTSHHRLVKLPRVTAGFKCCLFCGFQDTSTEHLLLECVETRELVKQTMRFPTPDDELSLDMFFRTEWQPFTLLLISKLDNHLNELSDNPLLLKFPLQGIFVRKKLITHIERKTSFSLLGSDVKKYVMELIDNAYKATDLNVVIDDLSMVNVLVNPSWSESKLSKFLSRLSRLLRSNPRGR